MKIIAADYDETLLLHDYISEATKNAIREWREAGNLFGINTARCFASVAADIKLYDVTSDFFVCATGCTIAAGDGSVLWEQKLNPGVARRALDVVRRHSPARTDMWTSGKQYGCYFDGWDVLPFDDDVRVWDGLYPYADDAIGISTTFYTLEDRMECDEELKKVLADDHEHNLCSDWLSFSLNPDTGDRNKATGIYQLLELLHLPDVEKVIPVGDGEADASMIREFKGYAMQYSSQAAIDAAEGRQVRDMAELIHRELGC